MGQYFVIANLDKMEYLHPHKFGDGLKFKEFGYSGQGTMAALAILLRQSDDRGGGDLKNYEHHLVGAWAGERIIIIGDYDSSDLWDRVLAEYEDISPLLVEFMSSEG